MSESEVIVCQASRRARGWVVHVPQYGVYGHGRTLKKLHENLVQGLALVGVTAEVAITPMTPELKVLRAAEAAYEAALRTAISSLALRRASTGDIAVATRVPMNRVKRYLVEEAQATSPSPAGPADINSPTQLQPEPEPLMSGPGRPS